MAIMVVIGIFNSPIARPSMLHCESSTWTNQHLFRSWIIYLVWAKD